MHFILGSSNDVSKFLCPSFFINERFVDGVFAGIDMKPTIFGNAEHFTPNMISPIQNSKNCIVFAQL